MAATFVVEDGTGLSTANSYVSRADATTYHDNHGAPTAWSGASQAQQEAALRMATQYIDATFGALWDGQRINETMALDWPRYGATDNDGFWVASNSVPQQVEDACAYLALKYLEGDTLLPDDASETNVISESVTVGPISTSTTYGGSKSTTKTYRLVDRLLGELTSGTGRVYRA